MELKHLLPVPVHPQAGHVDSSGQCVLLHAAQRGHLDVLHFLLKRADWSCASCCGQRSVSRSQAVQQALIAAANKGHTEVSYTLSSLTFDLSQPLLLVDFIKSTCFLWVDGVLPPGSSRGRRGRGGEAGDQHSRQSVGGDR